MTECPASRRPLPSNFRFVRVLSFSALFSLCVGAGAQTQPMPVSSAGVLESPNPVPDTPQVQSRDDATLRNTPVNFLKDQAAIWTSPFRVPPHDLEWLAPLALATGAAIATDHRAMTQVVSHDSGFNQANTDASNVMIGGVIAVPVALYGFGHFEQSEHAREAGILGGEALVDGVVVEQGMKLMFWRERPALDGAHGRFFQSNVGTDSSFPSSHSVLAWATASTIASEYTSRWTQLAVYSAATGVSLTRVLGQQHFPSDVLVGSAAGWLVGHYVVRRHRRHLFPSH